MLAKTVITVIKKYAERQPMQPPGNQPCKQQDRYTQNEKTLYYNFLLRRALFASKNIKKFKSTMVPSKSKNMNFNIL